MRAAVCRLASLRLCRPAVVRPVRPPCGCVCLTSVTGSVKIRTMCSVL
uniref:Uncharacterized protein n=1 Tax=Anopheles maculatus TaxID=74869 RepID=A0A182S5Y5_9DIPT